MKRYTFKYYIQKEKIENILILFYMSISQTNLFTNTIVYPWLKAISAVADGNNVIGNKGSLPWNYPKEYQFFCDTTKGHQLVYGKKTYQSGFIPEHSKLYVLSSQLNPTDDAIIIKNINEIEKPPENETLWVCGGQNVYSAFLPFCSELYISHIHGHFDGDTFFPEFKNLFHKKKVIYDCPEYTTVIYEHN